MLIASVPITSPCLRCLVTATPLPALTTLGPPCIRLLQRSYCFQRQHFNLSDPDHTVYLSRGLGHRQDTLPTRAYDGDQAVDRDSVGAHHDWSPRWNIGSMHYAAARWHQECAAGGATCPSEPHAPLSRVAGKLATRALCLFLGNPIELAQVHCCWGFWVPHPPLPAPPRR